MVKFNLQIVEALKKNMEESFTQATKNRDTRIEKEKVRHDRKIKKGEYEIGDYVLCNHPKLKKGCSRGLAHKYYGPFEVVGRSENKINYQIKKANRSPKKPFEINKSNNFMPSNAIANTNLKIQTNENTLSSSLSL